MSTIDLEQPPAGDESEAVLGARAYLAGESEEPPRALAADVAEALVAALLRRGDAARLQALAERGDKALSKRARRGLHLLRSRGVAVEVPRPAQAPALRAPAAEPPPPSIASAVVRDGEQMIWLVRDADTQLDAFQAQIRDVLGLVRFEPLRLSRKQWRAAVHEFYRDERLPVAPVDGAWARLCIEEAAARSVAAGRVPPREYAESRHVLGPVVPFEVHPAIALVPAAAVDAAAREPARFPAVLDFPEAATWIPDADDLQHAFLQVQEVATSRLIVDEHQRREQVDAVIRRAVESALATPFRARLAARLRDTALVILRRAEVGPRGRDYAGDAALALAAARQLDDAAVPAGQVELVHRLFTRLLSLDPRRAAEAEEDAGAARAGGRSPGGIILPGGEPE